MPAPSFWRGRTLTSAFRGSKPLDSPCYKRGKARGDPLPVPREFAKRNLRIEIAEGSRNRSDGAVAHLPPIDFYDRSHADGRAREEQLFGRIELAAVDASLNHFDVQFVAAEFDERVARDAFQYAVGHWRRDDAPAAHHEQVLGASFRYVTVGRQQYRLIEAVLNRFRLCERRADIDAGQLRASGRAVVVDSPPRRNADLQSFGSIEVRFVRHRHDREIAFDVVQPDADLFGRFECDRTHVDVLAVVVAARELHRVAAERFGIFGQRELQQLRGRAHAIVVLGETEEEQLIIRGAPIAADAFKAPGAVVESVREQADPRVAVRLELTAVVDDNAVEIHSLVLLP